jgi:DNA polymerase III epsilon subunit-like protein
MILASMTTTSKGLLLSARTGFGTGDKVVELGFIRCTYLPDKKRLLEETANSTIYNFGVKCNPKAAEVHGLTQKFIEIHGITDPEVLVELLETNILYDSLIIAYNASFDIRMLQQSTGLLCCAPTYLLDLANVVAYVFGETTANGRSYKTIKQDRAMKQLVGEDVKARHRALDDCRKMQSIINNILAKV